MAENLFDPAERARSKQAMRERQDRDLAAGRVSSSDLQAANSFISAAWSRQARIRDWKEFD